MCISHISLTGTGSESRQFYLRQKTTSGVVISRHSNVVIKFSEKGK